MPPNVSVCRICLATGVRMFPIGGALGPVYEKLAGTALHSDRRPMVACYICNALLHKAQRLMLRAATAEKVLGVLWNEYTVVTDLSISAVDRHTAGLTWSLAVSKLECLDTSERLDVKHEHLRYDYSNGLPEDWEGSDEEGSVPPDDPPDVKSEHGGQAADSSTELHGDLEDEAAHSTKSQKVDGTSTDHNGDSSFKPRRQSHRWTMERHVENGNSSENGHSSDKGHASEKGHFSDKGHASENECSRKNECSSENGNFSDDGHSSENGYTSKNYKCKMCGKLCTYRDQFVRHLRIHATKPFKCDLCERRFTYKHYLRIHEIKKHSGDIKNNSVLPIPKKSTCAVCKQQFSKRSSLRRHQSRHHKCNICGRYFNSMESLQEHSVRHNGKYKCNVCQYRTNLMGNLNVHKLTHLENRPFLSCESCPMRFTLKHMLRRHVERFHDRQNQCEACRRQFASREAFLAHMETHEPDEDETYREQTVQDATAGSDKPYQCSLCPMQFNLKIAFRRHVISEHL